MGKKGQFSTGIFNSGVHNKIEFTQFDDLVHIVTHSFQEWPEDRHISTEDLKNIFSGVNSFSELCGEIDKKLSEISLWDDVFSKYFENFEEWKQLEKSFLNKGLRLRHKVMHHRPMYLHELKQLQELETKFMTVLSSAKEKLGEEERTTANRISINISDMIRKNEELSKRFEPYFQAQQEFALKMEPILRRTQKFADQTSSISSFLYSLQEDENDNNE